VKASDLHVVTVRFDPVRWQQPHRHFVDWTQHILDSGAQLTVVEIAYGKSEFRCDLPHVNHLGLRADSWAWSKECGLNEGIKRLPQAEFIAWGDADVFHRQPDWARETVEYLQHYHVMQTWSTALDLGPQDQLLAVYQGFCAQYMKGAPLVPIGPKPWKHNGGAYDYPHSGYFWACKRELLDRAGGLFEFGGMGSGDHHMALGFVGRADVSLPGGIDDSYSRQELRWGARAKAFVNGRIGALPGMIEHRWHGSKDKRGYLSRWDMFIRHGFDPDTDLKRNSFGVLEFAGNKPELEREWDIYLRSRREDDNCL
jgi:hypothetical protein